jgi:hypothetical protein
VKWLLLRPVQIAIGVLLIGGIIWYIIRQHDARVRAEERLRATTEETDRAIAQQMEVAAALQDSLQEARARADTVITRTATAVTSYQRQRAAINTSAPRPAGVPEGMVVVPIAFVHSADSLARLVPELLATIRIEREASERLLVAERERTKLVEQQNAQLRLAIEEMRPNLFDKAKDLGLAAAVVYIGLQALKSKE